MTSEILVLNYGRCSHGRCTFCGYGRAIGALPRVNDINEKIKTFLNQIPEKTSEIKVFGSGSFLDDKQIPKDARENFVEKIKSKNIFKLMIESRPEHITSKKLDEFTGIELTVAFGLETANPTLLESVQKGFTIEEYANATKLVREKGCKVRTYLLVNIPGDDDIQGNLDASVEFAKAHSDTIVLINLLPHGNTPVFQLWIDGQWSFLGKKEFDEITEKYVDDPKIDLDFETFRFVPKFPEKLQEKIVGVGEDNLTHPYYEAWFDYLTRFYEPREIRPILFLPCSYSKPYSRSKTHRAIIDKLKKTGAFSKLHEVMLSNAGVIPREFENKYPYNNYDWNERDETPEIKKRYIEVTKERIKKYYTTHQEKYPKIYCYLKYHSESYKALDLACQELGVKFKNLLNIETYKNTDDLRLYSDEALSDLQTNLKWLMENST